MAVSLINFLNYVDENGNKINHFSIETNEQQQAEKYITPDSVVLELGARYGTVSCIINKKLNNQTNQVSVEPDERVWSALENNREYNNCFFHIVKGFISSTPLVLTNLNSCNGYATTSVSYQQSEVNPTMESAKSFTLEEIEMKYGLHFNTLVADCEGFLEQFLDENPRLYNEINLMILEMDYPNKCNYGKIINNLLNHGFIEIEKGFNCVWAKKL